MTSARFLPIFLAAAVLGACAGGTRLDSADAGPAGQRYARARLDPAGVQGPSAAPPASLRLAEGAPLPAPFETRLPAVVAQPEEAGPPLARVAAANRAAQREPSRHGYVNAEQVYGWAEGALYRLYTAPEMVSEIALEPGESLISVAAGDTVRWVIGDTASGAGAARRTHILVKPVSAGLRTNLVIATDRRIYHVALESRAGPAMASISWTYPRDGLLAVRRTVEGQVSPAARGSLDIEALNFSYAIEGDDPPWRPLRAFDDGSQVFIEFPERLAQDRAPPLFVSGEGGRAELVNYRVRGRFYVVDGLFAAAELRLGGRRQQVVRILAKAHGRAR